MSVKFRNELDRYYESSIDTRVTCICGHVNTMPVMKEYKICSWCGRKIKNDTKARFKYMLRRKINESARNEIRDRKKK